MDWMSILNSCLDVILPAIASIVAAVLGVLATKIKKAYQEKCDNETVKAIVDSAVRYVQQVYYSAEGQEKLAKATEKASTVLNEKGIKVSDTQLNMLIESAVYGVKQSEVTTESLPESTEEETDAEG